MVSTYEGLHRMIMRVLGVIAASRSSGCSRKSSAGRVGSTTEVAPASVHCSV